MKIYLLYKENEQGELTTDMDYRFDRAVRAYKNEGTAKNHAKRFKASYVEIDLEELLLFSTSNEEMLITSNFSQAQEDTFGKVVVANSDKARAIWNLWKKNPTGYTLAPGYIAAYNEDHSIITDAELIELSIIPKGLEKKDESSINK